MKKIRLFYTVSIDMDCEEDEDGNVCVNVDEIGEIMDTMILDNAEAFYANGNQYAGSGVIYEHDDEVAEDEE